MNLDGFTRFIDRPLRRIIDKRFIPIAQGPKNGQRAICKLSCGHFVRRKASDAARIHRTRCEFCPCTPLEAENASS